MNHIRKRKAEYYRLKKSGCCCLMYIKNLTKIFSPSPTDTTRSLFYLNNQNTILISPSEKTIENSNKPETLKKQPIEFIITENYANRLSLKEAIINILYSKHLASNKEGRNVNQPA